jgi:nitroimidazol reductase NimA-like FMN-containing flavoprotein (pyridoxamine 5'-phosphate oxidase superfamily)
MRWMDVSSELTSNECTALLAGCRVGRIGVVVDGAPVILPVNYRWVDDHQGAYVALRTRPGNIIDRASSTVAFEIDGIDELHQAGWSVLVRGTLHHLLPGAPVRHLIDSHPWLAEERDSWLVIAVDEVTGRRLAGKESEWAFHIRGYL